MKTLTYRAMAALAAAASTTFAASWTSTTLSDGQSVDTVSAVGTTISVTDPAASASVGATTGEGLFRANTSGSSAGYGALSLGMSSGTHAPALQAGANVSFAGRATPRTGWDFSWLGLLAAGEVDVSSGTVRVRDLTLPDSISTLVKSGAGDLAAGTVSASAVAVSEGTLTLGQAAPDDVSAPAADPVVWLAADRLRAEDLVEEDGTTYLARWYDARGAEKPAAVDGYTTDIPCALPMSTNKAFLVSRDDGPFPTVVANGLAGKPVIDFGTPWFAKDGYDWASSDSAYMGLSKADGSFLNSDFVREGFLVVAQNSQYDVPVVWANNSQFIHSGYGSVKNNTQGGGPILDLANASAKNTFGLWSIDAVPVSPTDAASFNTSAFKNGSYHLVSFKTSSTGGRSGPSLLASDRYNQNGVGGVRIAEVLYYFRALTDAERTQTQAYLMDKWGLGTHPATDDIELDSAIVDSGATLEYAGSGAMAVASAAVRGTMSAKSGMVSLTNDIADGAVLHLDASVPGTLDTFDDNGTVRVRSWRDVRDNGFVAYAVTNGPTTAIADNQYKTVYVSSLPTLHNETIGSKTMPCVDFGQLYKNKQVKAGDEVTAATMVFNKTVTFAEGYIVFMDSTETPAGASGSGQHMTIWGLVPNLNGNNSLLRGGSSSLYGSFATLDFGTITLDGVVRDKGAAPATGRFHAYTLRLNTGTDLIGSFGHDTDFRFGGLKVCEAIAFSEPLDDARRLRIEKYLMDKWFGAEHPAAASIVQETTEGLAVASGAALSFAGDVTMASGGSLVFGIDENGVASRIDVSGTVAFAGPQTLTVTSEQARLEDADHVLLSAGTMAEPADFASWTVSLPSGRIAKLAFEDNSLVLRVRRGGMVVFLR